MTDRAFISDPGPDDYYGLNDVITAQITFNEDVTVTAASNGDMPHLNLKLDPLPGSTSFNIVEMAYAATDGPNVTFSYTVVAADRASDSAAIQANGLKLNGATIKDENGNNADLTFREYFPASDPDWEYHQVDGRKSSDTAVGGL